MKAGRASGSPSHMRMHAGMAMHGQDTSPVGSNDPNATLPRGEGGRAAARGRHGGGASAPRGKHGSLEKGVLAGVAHGLDEGLGGDGVDADDLGVLGGEGDAHRRDAVDGRERTLDGLLA